MKAPRRILVKIGGAILDDANARAHFAESVAQCVAQGDQVVCVHGGGVQVTRSMDALGLTPRRERGLRVTDADTAQVVLQVLGGEVNARVVDAIERAGKGALHAIGLTGADGGLFTTEQLDVDLGYVGRVTAVDASVLCKLVEAGFVPVVATVAPGVEPSAPFFNVNADDAVAPIAHAWRADAVLFLSDVPHVASGSRRLVQLNPRIVVQLVGEGVIVGGMIPKTHAALDAAHACPNAIVKIASGQQDATALAANVITRALDDEFGTRFESADAEVTRA